MADLNNYTHKWRALPNHDHRLDTTNKVTKRNRQPVSCQPCRMRKLKCDRGHPCDGCSKRGEATACIYGKTGSNITTNGSTPRKDETRLSMKAQDRLKHLEDLVRSMVDPPPRKYASPEDAPSLDGILEAAAGDGAFDKNTISGGSYTGSTHWSAILQHIGELRTDLGTGNVGVEPVPEAIDYSKPDALFGGHRPHSLEKILKTRLPPRIEIDRRVTQYFSARYMVIPFLHAGQFRRQYEQFWADPLKTNVIWISKLFSVCCLAATLNLAASQAPSYRTEVTQQRDSFEAAAGECLVLGNYSKPQPHVVEALALFLQCKYGRSWDPQSEVALMFSMQIRLAYMMGYHRDGSNFPNQMSPFETEMRRRVWAMIRQFDLMVSFQQGIPNNVPPDSWDTKRPSNLLDSDFDEDTKVLQDSRPETEPTLILYFVVKSRIIDVYSKICHHALSFPSTPATLSEIMALDALARETANKIPDSLKDRPISQSITDQAFEIIVRMNISFLWRKSLCVLHRKYMIADGNDYSHRTCIETASAMCETFIDIYAEFQPGGTFANDGWMMSSFTIVDFLLVTMVLSLALSVGRKKFLNGGSSFETWSNLNDTKRILGILDKSHTICIELGEKSREARRVSGVLKPVLEKLKTQNRTDVARPDAAQLDVARTGAARHEELQQLDTQGSDASSSQINKQTRLSLNIHNKDSISLQPLSLAEEPISITKSSGLVSPEWYTDDRKLYLSGGVLYNRDKSDPVLDANSESDQINAGLRRGVVRPQMFSMNAAAPQSFSMDIDDDFVNSFVEDPGNFGPIDWTQLDQFTGFFGYDPNAQTPDNVNIPTIGSDVSTVRTQGTDQEDWDSVPLYLLGGSTFDPVTGDRR